MTPVRRPSEEIIKIAGAIEEVRFPQQPYLGRHAADRGIGEEPKCWA
jgi:hypothetical protein